MATIHKRGSYQFQATIRLKDFPSQSRTFETKREAEAWATIVESEMIRGIFIHQEIHNAKLVLNGPILGEQLIILAQAIVQLLLIKADLNANLVETMPYTVASTHEFEVSSPVIATVGIQEFFNRKISTEHRDMMLLPFTQSHFEAELRNAPPQTI